MTRIFISEMNKGWKEVEIPDYYKRYSHDALVNVAYQFIPNDKIKGILFTENPKIKGIAGC